MNSPATMEQTEVLRVKLAGQNCSAWGPDHPRYHRI